MPSDVFRKTPIASAVSLVIASALAPAQQAAAQEPEPSAGADDAALPGAVEEVIVVGFRQSLKESMDLKRARDGVVDAITAEDIGDFPDSNLAESLQRITG
ncbi:MAG: TonB-dependent receptor, partial [Gammaproteobacteria bacterium]|nr:TonB-dependent receptor [Gammaproteobacteria bacterium]